MILITWVGLDMLDATCLLLDLQNQPKIFAKGSNLHIRSGVEGNIVFEASQQGKVFFGSHELVRLSYRMCKLIYSM